MSNWQGFNLTDKGTALQAKIDAGLATLTFTKLAIGSGSSSSSSSSLTDLVSKEQDLTIATITASGSLVKITTTITNSGVTAEYKMREMGLYATDPDDGEILFAYMTDDTPDTMPAEGGTTVVSKKFTLNLTFSNTGNVSATLDSTQLVTFADLTAHDTNADAHDKMAATINALLAPTSNTDTVRNLLSYLANRYKTAAGVDDWKTDPATTLADIKTFIDQLASGSAVTWSGNKWTNPLTGESGLNETNGYYCGGPNKGGLIIQWGSQRITSSKQATLIYPVQFRSVLAAIAGVETATYVSCKTSNSNAIVDTVWFNDTYPNTNVVHVIAIGQ